MEFLFLSTLKRLISGLLLLLSSTVGVAQGREPVFEQVPLNRIILANNSTPLLFKVNVRVLQRQNPVGQWSIAGIPLKNGALLKAPSPLASQGTQTLVIPASDRRAGSAIISAQSLSLIPENGNDPYWSGEYAELQSNANTSTSISGQWVANDQSHGGSNYALIASLEEPASVRFDLQYRELPTCCSDSDYTFHVFVDGTWTEHGAISDANVFGKVIGLYIQESPESEDSESGFVFSGSYTVTVGEP